MGVRDNNPAERVGENEALDARVLGFNTSLQGKGLPWGAAMEEAQRMSRERNELSALRFITREILEDIEVDEGWTPYSTDSVLSRKEITFSLLIKETSVLCDKVEAKP